MFEAASSVICQGWKRITAYSFVKDTSTLSIVLPSVGDKTMALSATIVKLLRVSGSESKHEVAGCLLGPGPRDSCAKWKSRLRQRETNHRYSK